MTPSPRILPLAAFIALSAVQAQAGPITSSADPALAGGTVITFDSDPTNFYPALTESGVTFTSGTAVKVDDFDGQFNTSGHSISNSEGQSADLLITFSTPVTAFGFNYGAAEANITLNVYDTSNVLIDSVILPPNDNSGSGNDGAFAGYAASNIGSADLIVSIVPIFGTLDEILLDNVTFNPPAGGPTGTIPEPATLALLGLGLAGLGLARRRRSN